MLCREHPNRVSVSRVLLQLFVRAAALRDKIDTFALESFAHESRNLSLIGNQSNFKSHSSHASLICRPVYACAASPTSQSLLKDHRCRTSMLDQTVECETARNGYSALDSRATEDQASR